MSDEARQNPFQSPRSVDSIGKTVDKSAGKLGLILTMILLVVLTLVALPIVFFFTCLGTFALAATVGDQDNMDVGFYAGIAVGAMVCVILIAAMALFMRRMIRKRVDAKLNSKQI